MLRGFYFMEGRKKKKTGQLLLTVLSAAMLLASGIWYIKEYTSVTNSVNGREMPIHSVDTERKKIALTFEAAWGNEGTEKTLDILKKADAKAAFFVTGEWAEQFPDTLRRIGKEGHDLGSAGLTHQDLSQMEKAEQEEEIGKTHETVKKITGQDLFLFRPPYGKYNDSLIRTAEEKGYYAVCWSLDSGDWKEYGKEELVRAIACAKELQSGGIVRMHSEAKYTADALEEILLKIREKGYEPALLSDLIYKENYHMDVTGRQTAGPGNRR